MEIFLFSFKMAIKTAGSAQKIRVGRVAERQLFFFFGLNIFYCKNKTKKEKKINKIKRKKYRDNT